MYVSLNNLMYSRFTRSRPMYRLSRFIIILVFCGSSVHSTSAQPNPSLNFQTMSADINKAPWPNYQKLLKYQQQNKNLPHTRYLWLLLLKAQAENLLYFYDELENTIDEAAPIVTSRTPAEITSLLHFYKGLIEQRHAHYAKAIETFKLAMAQTK